MKYFSLFILTISSLFVSAQSIVVKPYLQNAEPTSMHVMWETSTAAASEVQFGTTTGLGTTVQATLATGLGNSRICDAELTGLQPATKYYYKAVSGNTESDVYHFITPPLKSSEASFNIVAMSDMQQDWSHPSVFNDIVDDNLIPYINQNYGSDIAEHLGYFVVPGDLVQTGSVYSSWASTFFEPAENLLSYVPLYPVPGNHEGNTPYFFQYFNLPLNGTMTNDYPEHWWYKDYSNVRLIGLESNGGYRVQAQLDWLQTVLDDAANDADIDFVFAQLHHPYESELWIAGNTDYTGDVITLLENFSTASGKPSVHFFGHTHGYSRGQSKEHNHVMVNVASAGGALDNWGEFAQNDYAEYSRSDDDFGYVIMEIQAGADPQFLLKRLSHGSYEDGLVTNVLKDTLLIKFNNPSPTTPTGIFPGENDILTPDCIIFLGSEFSDPEGDEHGATQWRIATDANFNSIIYDEWYQHENWYFDVDLMAGNNMVDQEVTVLQENTTYYWQVRYRDKSLAWSEWSDAIMFQTSTSSLTPNLLTNGGAEDGVNNWIEDQGSFESINSGECAGNDAYAGSKLFAVGGVCDDNAYGEGHQDVDVTAYSIEIDGGNVEVSFGGYLSDYNGADRPEFKLECYGATANLLATSSTFGNQTSSWTLMSESMAVPAGTRTIRMILMGTRNVGSDNDSYFDEMFVKLDFGSQGCEQYTAVGVEERIYNRGVHVYPNPFTDEATIEVLKPSKTGNYRLELFDRSGRLVNTLNSTSGKFTVDGKSFVAGMYFYQISDGDWFSTGKVVVQ
ncbi:MAG: fibronectin type III domain-containing protein [Flavobacteriales bacterium]|nr:fibronectin type III domain-containing protein [Flavobacteriales bacterium]